jgi:hypothetical protein
MFGTIFSNINKRESKIWGSHRGAAERLILVACDAVIGLLDPEYSQVNDQQTQNFNEEIMCKTNTSMEV